jgi:glycosyltransferase involved in cell wall biosynthesis
MKIAVVVPTRGDRPEFLNHCKRQIHRQTYCPDEVIFVDYRPVRSDTVDLTARYRKGIALARQKKCDFIAFWEDDDWYDPRYLEWMVKNWNNSGKPEVFGIQSSYYFNLRSMEGALFEHPGRSSMFCTCLSIKDDIWPRLTWPADTERFLDLWIWRKWNLSRGTVNFSKEIYTIGIKHGVGLTGGGGHNTNADFYKKYNYNKEWLHANIDDQSFQFYQTYEIRNSRSHV